MAPQAAVTVFEAGPKPLAKVAITGGGRCNLTNDFQGIRSLQEAYPRGERILKRALKMFSPEDCVRWFQAEGVPLVLQADHCWFPVSQDAMDIVRCLLKGMKGVNLRLNTPVTSIQSLTQQLCALGDEGRASGQIGFSGTAPKNDLTGGVEPQQLRALGDEGRASGQIGFSGTAPKNNLTGGVEPQLLSALGDEGRASGQIGFSNPVLKNNLTGGVGEQLQNRLLVNGEAFDFVVVTSGGAPKGLPFLESLGLELVPPVPSLFTFTIPDPALRSLMGLVTEAIIGLQGTAYKAEGPLLITDWGLSGPATLKLSSYAARHLAETGYKGTVCINWLQESEALVRERLQKTAAENPQKQLSNTPLLQNRLWNHLLGRAGLRPDIRWAELGSKGLNRLVAQLTNDDYPLSGKSRFREEFVTAGGVALSNVNPGTLECKQHPGLYFAGEVLDIDAITGGFNLQAAWSTGYVCAHSIAQRLCNPS